MTPQREHLRVSSPELSVYGTDDLQLIEQVTLQNAPSDVTATKTGLWMVDASKVVSRAISGALIPVEMADAPRLTLVAESELAGEPTPQRVVDQLTEQIGSVFGQADLVDVATRHDYPETVAEITVRPVRRPHLLLTLTRPLYTLDGRLRPPAFTGDAAAVRILAHLDQLEARPANEDGRRRVSLDDS